MRAIPLDTAIFGCARGNRLRLIRPAAAADAVVVVVVPTPIGCFSDSVSLIFFSSSLVCFRFERTVFAYLHIFFKSNNFYMPFLEYN